jgi:hypothetical protein
MTRSLKQDTGVWHEEWMNTNYKMYFSKYVLINLPAQNLNPGSNTHKLSLFTLTLKIALKLL